MPAAVPMANWCLPSASASCFLRVATKARPTNRRKAFGAAIGLTPPPGLRKGVSLERASAEATASGTRPWDTRAHTSQKAARADGEVKTTRQCSKRPPPTAAPLPFGLVRSACFSALRESGGSAVSRGSLLRGSACRGCSKPCSVPAVSGVSGARPGLASKAVAREYSPASAFRTTSSAT